MRKPSLRSGRMTLKIVGAGDKKGGVCRKYSKNGGFRAGESGTNTVHTQYIVVGEIANHKFSFF